MRKSSVLPRMLLAIAALALLPAAIAQAQPAGQPSGPEWARNLPVYEVNLFQYTPEGTFRAFERHLPSIRALGVGIIWLMPIHPVGADARSFGSFYCVRNYLDVHPELGTKEDLRHLIVRIHELGMYVIMDWVPNHSSWDNPLIQSHPEWYQKDENGKIRQAHEWKDVAAFDYSRRDLWRWMADAYTFWVREYQVDGFRCDVAWGVPIQHWRWLRPELAKYRRPLLLLAEANEPRHHPAFDMTYDWNLPEIMWGIAKGTQTAKAIDGMLQAEKRDYPAGAIRMRFTYNHDYNWKWRLSERYGDGVKAFAVLCATLPGKPLILNGQEVGLDRSLPVSTRGPRQPIEWVESPFRDFYTRLFILYRSSPALYSGNFVKVPSSDDSKVFAYLREMGAEKVLVILNLSAEARRASLRSNRMAGSYVDLFGGSRTKLGAQAALDLKAWGYRVLVQSKIFHPPAAASGVRPIQGLKPKPTSFRTRSSPRCPLTRM